MARAPMLISSNWASPYGGVAICSCLPPGAALGPGLDQSSGLEAGSPSSRGPGHPYERQRTDARPDMAHSGLDVWIG